MSKDGKKKGILKRWWFWTIVIVVIIAIAASSGGGKDSTKQTTAPTTSTTKNSKESTKKPTKSYKIGDTVTVGKMTYKINGMATDDRVGPKVLPTQASGKYVILDVTVQNKGNESVTIDTSYFTLLQGKKKFDADSEASMSANQGENGTIKNSFFLQKLNPESKARGKVVFDVAPSIASSKNLQVEVQEGVFGTVSKVINLKK